MREVHYQAFPLRLRVTNYHEDLYHRRDEETTRSQRVSRAAYQEDQLRAWLEKSLGIIGQNNMDKFQKNE